MYSYFICGYSISNSCKSQPKSQPKSAATTKAAGNAGAGANAGGKSGRGGRGRRGGRNARPARKTAEELDSEMVDYFGNNGTATTEAGATTDGAAQPAANGDAMEDEILVSFL